MPRRFAFHGPMDEEDIQITGYEWLHLFKYINRRHIYVLIIALNFVRKFLNPLSTLIQGNLANLLVEHGFSDGKEFLDAIHDVANQHFGLLIIETIFMFFSMILNSYFVTHILCDLKTELLKTILHQEIGFFDKTQSGVLMSRIDEDSSVIINIYVSNLFTIIDSIIGVVMDTFILFFQSKKLMVYLICYFPLHIFLHWFMNRKSDERWLTHNKKRSRVSAKAEEILTSMRTVRSFDAGEREYQAYKETLMDLHEIVKKDSLTHGIENVISTIINWGCICMILYVAGIQAANHEIEPGAIIIFMGIHGEWQNSLITLMSTLIDFKKANVSAAKLIQILERDPLIKINEGEEVKDVKGAIDFKDVVFTYPSRDKPALDHLTFHINPGETVAIVGESGCGKSTTLQLIERFYDCQEGQVLIDGRDLKTISPDSLRKYIGYVPQLPVMFSMNIKNNIRYGKPEEKKEKIINAAKLANAHSFIIQQPNGYNTKVHQNSLSGGQKQRICIARAMVLEAPIVLLDEATAALDAESEQLVQKSIQEYKSGRTMIIVAHRLSTVIHADRILVMSEGKIIEEGTHASLIEKGGAYAELVKHQLL